MMFVETSQLRKPSVA